MILNSIIRRWKFSVIKDQVIEKTLLDLERDLDE